MNVICHYDERVQVEKVEVRFAVLNCLHYAFRDTRILKPEGAGLGAVKFSIEGAELLSCFLFGFRGVLLHEVGWQGSMQPPRDEYVSGWWVPMREVARVVGHFDGSILHWKRKRTDRNVCATKGKPYETVTTRGNGR